MRVSRLLAAAAFALAAVLAPARTDAFSVRTSLYDLVGGEGAEKAKKLAGDSGNSLVVIAVSTNAAASYAAAKGFVDSIPKEYLAGDTGEAGADISASLEGRVTAEDAELMKTPEGRAKIAKRAVRRYIASPMPPLFPPEEDPFLLKERFAVSLGTGTNAIIPVALAPAVAGDIDRLISVFRDLRERASRALDVTPHSALSTPHSALRTKHISQRGLSPLSSGISCGFVAFSR